MAPHRTSDRWAGLGASGRLPALARTLEVLLAPHAWADDVAWRTQVAAQARMLFTADYAVVQLAGAPRPFVGDGVDASDLDAWAAFHATEGDDDASAAADARRAAPRVRYRDPALERLQSRRLAATGRTDRAFDPVFTRRGNEVAMGRSVEGTPMFDAVCRPLGIVDFHGVFARTVHGDLMLFLAYGRRPARAGIVEASAPLLRVLSPAVHAAVDLLGASRVDARTDAPAAALPDPATLRVRFGLTPREAEVALGLARGRTRHEIALALGMRPATVRHHTEGVFRKLDVHTRGAVAVALLGGVTRAGG